MSLRSGIVGILGLGSLITVTQAQQPQFHAPGQDGGVREVLESIVIPPIPQAPFTTTLDTESVKYSGDGASINTNGGPDDPPYVPRREKFGAGNGIRTRDFDLGKVALYH